MLTITLVAFESLAVAIVMPAVETDLGGLALYGWVFSGFFLASLLGIVVAGQLADRRGLALPFTAGLVLFGIGLAIGGAAWSMPVLVVGRVAQGLGAGAIPATVYAAIGRGYPAAARPTMFATTSTAWVIPGLIGPTIAAVVAHAWSWRVVFLGLLPIVVVAMVMTIPALAALGPPVDDDGRRVLGDPAADRRGLQLVVILVAAVGAVLAVSTGAPIWLGAPVALVGIGVAIWAFKGLVPDGTLRLAPGVPVTVAVRGLLTWGFFGADAYISLAVIDGRGGSTFLAGAALSVGCLTWTAGSWTQAHLIDRLGPRRLDQIGFTAIAASVVLMVAVALTLPVWLAVAAWSVGCFGMGLAYSPLSSTVLAAARKGEEGVASAALQLSDTLGIAVGTGIGGSIVAFGDRQGWAVSSSTAVVFASSLVVVLGGLLAAGRLPERVPDQA